MTDTPQTSATENQPETQQVAVNVQYIKDFSFECPNAPDIFGPQSGQPQMNMGVNIHTRPLGDGRYDVILAIKLETTVETKTAFIAELAYGGVFTVPQMPEDQLKLFLFVQAPHLLFPFARSILANVIRDAGFPQILINPIDFYALFLSQQAQQNAA